VIEASILEPGTVSCCSANPRPEMSHRAAILFALVGQHVDDEKTSTGFQHARALRK
jgi:hypothetical protein